MPPDQDPVIASRFDHDIECAHGPTSEHDHDTDSSTVHHRPQRDVARDSDTGRDNDPHRTCDCDREPDLALPA